MKSKKPKQQDTFKKLKELAEAFKSKRSDCPDCNPKCPYCDRPWERNPWHESQCVLNKPLWMVIPPGGVHLSCPVHPEGHHVFGPPTSWHEVPMFKSGRAWCEYDSSHRPVDLDSSHRPIDLDSSRPYGTCTGENIR